jgi:hypothetical protein
MFELQQMLKECPPSFVLLEPTRMFLGEPGPAAVSRSARSARALAAESVLVAEFGELVREGSVYRLCADQQADCDARGGTARDARRRRASAQKQGRAPLCVQ